MNIPFYKYEGTGNDFILIDNRKNVFLKTDAGAIAHLCDRRFGIGADGLMLLQDRKGYDFEMIYFNSDGHTSSMCGNGGRCITAFARFLGIVETKAKFIAIDGDHEAVILQPLEGKKNSYRIKLKMQDVPSAEIDPEFIFVNTGSPHFVQSVKDVAAVDLISEAHRIRYSERFKKEGTNVNFMASENGGIVIRTYERGVEGETLSCGTGSTASALAASLRGILGDKTSCDIRTMGGTLKVHFEKNGQGFKNIWLEGPATFVFKGESDV